MVTMTRTENGVHLETDQLEIDVSRPKTFRVVAVDSSGRLPNKEYFLKVTERKGLVLV